jgi:hypothetical protein
MIVISPWPLTLWLPGEIEDRMIRQVQERADYGKPKSIAKSIPKLVPKLVH